MINFSNNYKFFFTAKGISLVDKIRIKTTKRHTPFYVKLFGKKFKVVDSRGFYEAYIEIFGDHVYAFKAETQQPVLVDCGANMGLAGHYFLNKYPGASYTAYEADPFIFSALKENLSVFPQAKVELVNKAVWYRDEQISFETDGSLGGKIGEASSTAALITAFRLKDVLTAPIDFLKIDIEGAENKVITDCAGSLKLAKNIFIEYHSSVHDGQMLGEILNTMKEEGFRYQIHQGFSSRLPYLDVARNGDFDLQLNIYGYK
ncbi:MAG: FkbM family methyltransferase [Bacteroidota bacterium]